MNRLEATNRAIELVRAEVAHAVDKFPEFNSPHEGYAVIKEELDELWDDVKANRPYCAVQEAIQVAAMAIRFITDLEGAAGDAGGSGIEVEMSEATVLKLEATIAELRSSLSQANAKWEAERQVVHALSTAVGRLTRERDELKRDQETLRQEMRALGEKLERATETPEAVAIRHLKGVDQDPILTEREAE